MRYPFILLVVFGFLKAGIAHAQNAHINTTATDPFRTCAVLEKNLPSTLKSIRKMGKVQSEKARPDLDYCKEQKQCSIHELTYTGLKLSLLVNKRLRSASVLSVELSNSSWDFLGDIRVGEQLPVLENHYGVKLSKDVSPVALVGECTPLTVWHRNGYVTKLHLDCQACN